MAEQEMQKVLTDKKPSEMTEEDIRALVKPVGLPGLPYPMAQVTRNAAGMVERDVWLVESKQSPLIVYTERGIEEVNGKLFREMPIPGMMLMLRELLTRMGPKAESRIMAVFGDAAFGKSHLFRLVGDLVHPKGPIVVDCGGMNMRELFFRTVIDYGKGVKEQLEQKVANGRIKEGNLNLLEEAFPGSVIRKNDKALINWDAIGQRKTEVVDNKTSTIESYEEASSRASRILNQIYQDESISIQHNAFGIKTVKGEIFESIESGRPIFLDEFNKSKKGTLDSFQTFLQLAKGEISHVTIQNPMATDGDDDSPKAITVRREDLAVNWFFGIAGNDTSDGDTTQELSVSMETRLGGIMRVGQPETRDWAHRISQVYTGLPLTTLYNLFEGTAKASPAEFSQFLIDLRELGLTPEERKTIPPHERYLLQNFQDAVTAINQMASAYDTQLQLADPASELLGQKAYEDLADEISSGAKRLHVSFRTVIDDRNKALQKTVEARPAREATLTMNLKDVFRSVDLADIGRGQPGWHTLGKNLVQVFMERIANDTIGMPNTAAALMTLCEENGIILPDLKEAKLSKSVKPLPDLLKYDPLKDVGGTEELRALQSLLMAGLRSKYPDIKSSPDMVIPLEKLGAAVKDMETNRIDTPKTFTLPSDNLDEVSGRPLIDGRAIPNYDLEDPTASQEYILADFRTTLAALALPDYADKNRARIWPVEIEQYVQSPESNDEREALDNIQGKSEAGFDLNILASGKEGSSEPVYLYLLEDKFRKQVIVVGPDDIGIQLKSDLSKNGVSYLIKGSEGAEDRINEFLSEGVRARTEAGKPIQREGDVVVSLMRAFSTLCELPGREGEDDRPGEMTIDPGYTFGKILQLSKGKPYVFTSIVKPRSPGR